MFTVYILYSQKLNNYYTGFTTDLEARLVFHTNAQTGKFTAKADDWELFAEFSCESKSQGLKIEKHIKNMKSKVYIENLKKYPEIIEKLKRRYAESDC